MNFEPVDTNFDLASFELDEYYLIVFKIVGVPFYAMVDKESRAVIDIYTLTNGNHNASHPYDKDTSLKFIDWLPLNYFEMESIINDYIKVTFPN